MALHEAPDSDTNRLQGIDLTLKYDRRTVAERLSVSIPDNSLTMIIGPNACGKSTLLRALSRMLEPTKGKVLLDGTDIATMHTKQVARKLGLLPQTSIAPDGITVMDLVARGRYPHQGLLRQWTVEDEQVVYESMRQTNVEDLASRYVDELSGGQRQRVWLAMALAQETSLLLLDEPTTFLDLAHQIEVLDLCADLHQHGSRTIVVVLHELNLAARYATHLIVMRDGAIQAQGRPADILDAALIEATFDLQCRVVPDPETQSPMIIPRARQASRASSRSQPAAAVS